MPCRNIGFTEAPRGPSEGGTKPLPSRRFVGVSVTLEVFLQEILTLAALLLRCDQPGALLGFTRGLVVMIYGKITGNVGRDPELRTTASGKTVCNFSVASSYKSKNGQNENCTWIDVVCFDDLGQDVAEKIMKGAKVMVSGRMELQTFEKKDGTVGHALRCYADDVGLHVWQPGSANPNPDRDAVGSRKGAWAGETAAF